MSKTFFCLNCNTEISSEYSWRNPKYCSLQCRSEFNRTTISCKYCKKEFTVQNNKAKSRKFCSKKCSNRYNRPITKKDYFICEWCGNRFYSWKYRQNRFCSNQCRSEFAARQPKSTYMPEIHVILNCVICNSEYETTTHHVRLRGSSCCSTECVAELNSRRMKGKNNPNWHGGITNDGYGSNWQRQSRKARKRDDYTCQNCGYKSKTRNLDVHHIIPIKYFNGDWKNANKLYNLICLCRSCHRKVDNKIYIIQSELAENLCLPFYRLLQICTSI